MRLLTQKAEECDLQINQIKSECLVINKKRK